MYWRAHAGVVIIKKFFESAHYEDFHGFLGQLFNLQLIAGVFLYMAGFLTWLYVLSRMDLNTAYPVAITLSFVAVLLASTFILKEHLTINIGDRYCIVSCRGFHHITVNFYEP